MQKLYCQKCGELLPKYTAECDKCGYFSEGLYPAAEAARKQKKTIVSLTVLTVVLALVVFLIWDSIDAPMWWQFERQEDKKAILMYVEEKYGDDIEVIDLDFPVMNPGLVAPPAFSRMGFRYDDVEFYVAAKNGYIVGDGYLKAKANTSVEKWLNNFFDSHGIDVQYSISYSDDLNQETASNLLMYNGKVKISLDCDIDNELNDVKWLYDLYLYCQNDVPIKHHTILIECYIDDITFYRTFFDKTTKFDDEQSFYESFRYIAL